MREELQIDPARLGPDTPLRDLGLDSIVATRLLVALEGRLGTRIDATQLWEQPTVGALARHLSAVAVGVEAVQHRPMGQRVMRATCPSERTRSRD